MPESGRASVAPGQGSESPEEASRIGLISQDARGDSPEGFVSAAAGSVRDGIQPGDVSGVSHADAEASPPAVSSRAGRWSTSDENAVARQLVVVLRFPVLTQRAWWRVVSWLHSQHLLTDEELRICAFLNQGRQRIDASTGWIVAVDHGTGEVDGGMGLAERYAHVHGLCEATFWEDLKRVRRKGLVECVVRPAGGRIPRKARYALCLHARLLQDLPRGIVVPKDLAEVLTLHLAPRPQDLPDPTVGSGPGPTTMLRREPEAAAVRFAGDPKVVNLTPAQAKELASAPRWKDAPQPAPAKATSPGLSTGQALLGRRFLTRPETSPYYAKTFSPFSLETQVPGQARYQHPSWKSRKAGASAAARRAEPEPTATELRAAEAALSRAWHTWRADLGAGRVNFSRRFFDEAGRGILTETYRDLRRTVAFALRRTGEQHVLGELTRSLESARDLVPFISARLWRIVDTLPPCRDAAPPRPRGRRAQPGTTFGQSAALWAESSDRGRAVLAEQAGPSYPVLTDNPLDPAYADHRIGLFELEQTTGSAAAAVAPQQARTGLSEQRRARDQAAAAAQAEQERNADELFARIGLDRSLWHQPDRVITPVDPPSAPLPARTEADSEQLHRQALARRDEERGRESVHERLARWKAQGMLSADFGESGSA